MVDPKHAPSWGLDFICGFAMLTTIVGVPALAIFWPDLTAAPWALLAACGLAVVFSRLDQIAEFTLGPIKARMRETLSEATASLDQLRKVAVALGDAAVLANAGSLFSDAISYDVLGHTNEGVLHALEGVGVQSGEIERIRESWRQVGCLRFYLLVHRKIYLAPKTPDTQQAQDFDSLGDVGRLRAPSPGQLRAFLKRSALSTPDLEQVIDAYEEFLRSGVMPQGEAFWEGT